MGSEVSYATQQCVEFTVYERPISQQESFYELSSNDQVIKHQWAGVGRQPRDATEGERLRTGLGAAGCSHPPHSFI